MKMPRIKHTAEANAQTPKNISIIASLAGREIAEIPIRKITTGKSKINMVNFITLVA